MRSYKTEAMRVPLKVWDGDSEVPMDPAVLDQIAAVASLPFVGPHAVTQKATNMSHFRIQALLPVWIAAPPGASRFLQTAAALSTGRRPLSGRIRRPEWGRLAGSPSRGLAMVRRFFPERMEGLKVKAQP